MILTSVVYSLHENLSKPLGTLSRVTARPKELTVAFNPALSVPPTHVFAVCRDPDAQKPGDIPPADLYAVHDLVFAAHCARLLTATILPASAPSGNPVTIPVVPLQLPFPACFPLLLEYLYLREEDTLRSRLLRLDRADAAPPSAATIAATMDHELIFDHLATVYNLYANACRLGLYDDGFWSAIETSWSTLRRAYAICRGVRLNDDSTQL